MTYMDTESLEYKAQIKNDYEHGYDDAMKGDKAVQGRTPLYYDGYAQGFKFRGSV